MAPTTEPAPATTEPRGRHVIVLDPGHGGKDPGALGEGGLREKAVTWATARLLTRILEERGYEVHLTREGDEYIDLPDRIRIARERNADMFISLHADANPVAEVRGASVYTLSKERSDRMARDAAASGDFRLFDHELSREDQEISSILYDLASTDTKNQSARLASSLVDEMKGRVRLVNNSHREAGLVVLLSPDVPAVLIELAFMSNASDRANLGSPTWRKTAATAIADGIDRYFELVDNRRASYAE